MGNQEVVRSQPGKGNSTSCKNESYSPYGWYSEVLPINTTSIFKALPDNQGPIRAIYETVSGNIMGLVAHPSKYDRYYHHRRDWAWSHERNNWTYIETVGDEMLFSPYDPWLRKRSFCH
jgi:hypothetical protein